MDKQTTHPIRVGVNKTIFNIRWTGKKFVDRAGHKWEVRDSGQHGLRWFSPHHGWETGTNFAKDSA